MKKIILILLTFNIMFAYVGKVTALIGKADIIRSGKTIPAKISMDLDNKDIIKTYSESKMQIVFNDNSVITIGKNSTFKIEDYVFDEQPKARFKVLNGAIKSLTGRIGKIAPNKFKIETKNAVIGIRGTEFVVEYKNEITKVGVLYGKVEFVDKISNVSKVVSEGQLLIFNPKTPKKKIIIKQGFKEPKAFKVKPKKSKKSTSGENKKTATQSKKTAQANKSEQTNKSSQNKQAAKSEQKSQQTQTNKNARSAQSKQNSQQAANKTATNQTAQPATQSQNKEQEQTNTNEQTEGAQTQNEQSTSQNEAAQIAQSRENENVQEVSQNENTQTEEVTANIQTQQTETANNDIEIEISTPQETANVDTSDVENITSEISQETATVDDEKKQNDVEENVKEHLENNQPDNNDQQGNTDDNGQNNNGQQGNNGQISMDDIKPPLFPDVVDNSELKNDNELVINTALKESSEELKNYGIENGYFDSVTVDISSNKNTPVDIYVDNQLYQTVIVNGDKEVELNLPAGEHNIQVVYNGENVDLGNVVVVKKEDFDKYSQEGIFPPNLPSEDDLDKQTLYSDSYLSYGYWANDNNEFVDTWIEGTVTPEDAVNNLITNQVTASYQGGLAAFINGEQSNGNININIDFGNMEFDGHMKFGESEKYSVDFSGDINVHGFGTRNVSAADDSDVEIQSGEINGKFYGNNAEAVGGEFELNDNVKGVYQAIKK